MGHTKASRLGYALVLTASILVLLTSFGRPAVGKSHGEQVIAGEVFVEEYDGSGEVSSVSILDESWGKVLVSPAGKGLELLDRIGSYVEATGTVDETDEGDYIITVKSYKVVDVEDDESEEDDSYEE